MSRQKKRQTTIGLAKTIRFWAAGGIGGWRHVNVGIGAPLVGAGRDSIAALRNHGENAVMCPRTNCAISGFVVADGGHLLLLPSFVPVRAHGIRFYLRW
jgi:hypothetical protein